MNWTPVPHKVVKDISVRDTLHDIGYFIAGNIGIENIVKLKDLYKQTHSIKTKEGGMFYSLYSLDLDYRKKVNDGIFQILKGVYDEKFQDYKTVINSFIIKINGKQSEFTLHQDSTGLDEFLYSPLSVWIPLQDTTIENGCLCVVPKSHKIFYPYRGISFQPPFHKIENIVRKYLVPIEMKAGDILLFDNRLVHYSPVNNTKEPRIVAMSGVFPAEAGIICCYKEPEEGSPIEIYEQGEDFLITNTKFYHDCTARPIVGQKTKEVNLELKEFSDEQFLQSAEKNGITPTNIPEMMNIDLSMHIISEPDENIKKYSFFSKIAELIK